MKDSLFSIKNLSVHYPVGKGVLGAKTFLKAVDGVSLEIPKGSFFGLVGESGSGKSTLGRAMLQVAPITEGTITYTHGGVIYDIGSLKKAQLKSYRRIAQLIFQDPYAALSPRMTVRDILAEPLEVMGITKTRAETDEKVREIAALCRLNLEHLRRYPHAFSGGQRQRISIARALASITKMGHANDNTTLPDEAHFLVADECVAALDVSIRADIINLLKNLRDKLGLTFLFISHDLSVVAYCCDEVAVMYLGRIVEKGPTRKLFSNPLHPYTRALLSAVPALDPDDRGNIEKLKGEIPSPLNPPLGCSFHTRCPHAQERCRQERPVWRQLESKHHVACHFAENLLEKS